MHTCKQTKTFWLSLYELFVTFDTHMLTQTNLAFLCMRYNLQTDTAAAICTRLSPWDFRHAHNPTHHEQTDTQKHDRSMLLYCFCSVLSFLQTDQAEERAPEATEVILWPSAPHHVYYKFCSEERLRQEGERAMHEIVFLEITPFRYLLAWLNPGFPFFCRFECLDRFL